MNRASATERIARWWREKRRSLPLVGSLWEAIRQPAYALGGVLLRRGCRVHLATGDLVRVHPAFVGWSLEQYEPELMRWLASTLRPGDSFLDVGAHVGFFSLLASRLVGVGRVVAIEASPPTVKLLRRHLAMNRAANVSVISGLASSREGEGEIAVRANPTDPGACANSIAYRIPGGRCVRVPIVTLDRVAAKFEIAPRVIKVDVEGAELEVLRGAERLLREVRPLVACAVHPDPLRALGSSAGELVRWMAEQGYICRSLTGEPIELPGEENVLFTPREVCRGDLSARAD